MEIFEIFKPMLARTGQNSLKTDGGIATDRDAVAKASFASSIVNPLLIRISTCCASDNPVLAKAAAVSAIVILAVAAVTKSMLVAPCNPRILNCYKYYKILNNIEKPLDKRIIMIYNDSISEVIKCQEK